MKQLLTLGLSLLWNPFQSWVELRTRTVQTVELVAYLLFLGLFATALRVMGYLAIAPEWTVIKAIAAAFLFILFLLGTASGAGVLIGVLTRRVGLDFPEPLAQRITLLSCTPMLLLSVFLPIFSQPWLHTALFLLGLGWGGFLIHRGMWTMIALRSREILVLSLITVATWVVSVTVLIQVGHLMLSA